jgi:hypothetical protein
MIYSSFLMYVEHFTASEAVPISSFLILICSLCTFYMGVQDKLTNPKNAFIDYDIVIIFAPPMLLGTKIGTILNKVLPNFLVCVAMGALMIQSTYKNYNSAIKQRKLELDVKQLEGAGYRNLSAKDTVRGNDFQQSPKSLTDRKSSSNSKCSPTAQEIQEESRQNISILTHEIRVEENSPIRKERIKFLFMLLGLLLVDQIIEGNAKLPSFIGISRCSTIFWLFFFGFAGLMFYITNYLFHIVKTNYQYKVSVSKEFVCEKYSNIEGNMNKIIALTFLGGIIAGLVGIGGGLVITPILLGIGSSPKVIF